MSEEAIRDYGGLGGIIVESFALQEELKIARPQCPLCSFTLVLNSYTDVWACPMGHFQSATVPVRGDF